MYINKMNTLSKIINKKIELKNENLIKKEELIKLINDNKKSENINFKIKNILLYNITLLPDEINFFIENDNLNDDSNTNTNSIKYMREINLIDDIYLQDSIYFFSDLNTLFLLFKELDNNITTPNKSSLKNKEENNNLNKNNTKKVRFNIKKIKTRKHR